METLTAVVSTCLLVGMQRVASTAPRSTTKLMAVVFVGWLLLAMPIGASASGQWNPQKSNTAASWSSGMRSTLPAWRNGS